PGTSSIVMRSYARQLTPLDVDTSSRSYDNRRRREVRVSIREGTHMAKRDTTGYTKPRQFRLSDEINDLIDRLAAHYDLNRTDIVRLGVRKLEKETPNLAPAKRSRPKGRS